MVINLVRAFYVKTKAKFLTAGSKQRFVLSPGVVLTLTMPRPFETFVTKLDMINPLANTLPGIACFHNESFYKTIYIDKNIPLYIYTLNIATIMSRSAKFFNLDFYQVALHLK